MIKNNSIDPNQYIEYFNNSYTEHVSRINAEIYYMGVRRTDNLKKISLNNIIRTYL